MAAAQPATLSQDTLEVSRGHHLLGAKADELTAKAVKAAERRLAAKEVRKQARIKANRSKAAQHALDQQEDADMADSAAMDTEQAEKTLLDVVDMAVDASAPAADQREKIKVKVKASKKKSRSLLVPAGSAMSMD